MRPTLNMQGALIGGRYQLEELIGEGGMGGVFRARDDTLQRLVAVKLLFSGDERDRDQRVDRFLREARIAAAVQHRNVVQIVDFGSTEDSRPYMVMEYLKGETLAQRLARAPEPSVEEVVQTVANALSGLAAAHDAGVVHRDMKPENIFLVDDPDGAYPKILDFGISRSLQPESGPSSALTTREGFLVGTPQYMSPEQARGHKDIDRVTDIYSIGVILYEALAGRLPFTSEHVGDLIILIASGNAPLLSKLRVGLGEPISQVVQKAMSIERDERYPDARAMRDALLEALGETTAEARALKAFARERRSLPPPPTDASRPSFTPTVQARGPESGSRALAETMEASGDRAGGGAATDSIETPAAWTVDGEVPRRSPSRSWIVVALGVLAIGGGVALAFGTRDPDAVPQDSAAPQPRGTAAAGLVEEIAETVTVTLRGVPAGARVTADGETMHGDTFQLERDGRAHAIAVAVDGMRAWTGEHVADDDGEYAVALEPEADEGEPGAVDPGEESVEAGAGTGPIAGSARPRGTMGGANRMTSMDPPAAILELDY